MELSRGAFGRLVVAKNLAGVAEPDRALAFDEARGHRARDERSQLRPQRQQRAVTVDEAICPLGLLLAHPAREQVVVIEHRQYDLVIRPAREDFHSASFDEAAQSYFVVEEILDACRNFGKRRHMRIYFTSLGGCHPTSTQLRRTSTAISLLRRNASTVARPTGVKPTMTAPS